MIHLEARARCRVLIADDMPDIRSMLGLMLMGDRFEVVGEARDGGEAAAMAADLQPDVLLLDLSMPVLDGLEVIPLVRASSPATRILVFSGFDASQVSVAAFRAGAHGYLSKGATRSELLAALEKVRGETPQA